MGILFPKITEEVAPKDLRRQQRIQLALENARSTNLSPAQKLSSRRPETLFAKLLLRRMAGMREPDFTLT